jgi:hypothetical protein
LAIPFSKRYKIFWLYLFLKGIFLKGIIYMSLSEQEKNNLVNDGKFTQQQVDFFSDNGIRYDVIKNLQSVTQEYIETRNRVNDEQNSLALEHINASVIRHIQGCVTQFQRANQYSSRRNINHYVMAIISDISTQIEDLNDAEENASLGGKRRKTRKSKRRLQTRRRKRRSSRAKKITKTR